MKLKKLWIPALLLTLVGGAAKICDTLFNINGNGFFIDSFTCSCIFTVAFLLLYVIGYALSFADRKKRFDAQINKNILCGAFGFLASVMIIGTGVVSLIVLDNSKIVESLFAVAAGGILLYESCISFTGQNGMKKVPVAGLILPVWCCLRFISLFSQYTQKSLHATEIFDIIALAFLVMFLFYQAMFFAGINNSNAVRKSVVYGTVYIMLGLVVSADLLIKMISGGEIPTNIDTFTVSPTLINIMTITGDITLCIYAIFFTRDVLKAAQTTLRPDEDDDDEEVLISGENEVGIENQEINDKPDEDGEKSFSDINEDRSEPEKNESSDDSNEEQELVDINTAITVEQEQEETVSAYDSDSMRYPENVHPVSAQPYEEMSYDKKASSFSENENETASESGNETETAAPEKSVNEYSSVTNETAAPVSSDSELKIPGVSSPASAPDNSGSDAYEELMQMLDDLSSGS